MKWDTIALGEMAVQRGGSVNPKKFQEEVFELYSIPAFDSGSPEIVKGSEIGSSKKCVQSHDVMISRIVPHIRRAWVVGTKSEYRQIASGEWIIFRSEKIWPNYLRWVLVGDVFHAAFMRTVSGVGGSLLRARPTEVYKIKVPLPPLAEQKRIAGILDAADALRTKRREALAHLDTLLQSTFLDMFGDPVLNPMGWEGVSMEGIASRVTKGESPKWQGFEYQSHGVLFVTSENVREGVLDISKPKFIPIEFNNKLSRSELRKNDILVNLVGASIGRSCLFPGCDSPANINQAVGVISLKPEVEPVYVASFLATEQGKKMLLGNRVEAARANISLKNLRELQILLPPLHLQRRFAAIVAAVERQKARQRAHLAELDTLFAALQHRAFTGDL